MAICAFDLEEKDLIWMLSKNNEKDICICPYRSMTDLFMISIVIYRPGIVEVENQNIIKPGYDICDIMTHCDCSIGLVGTC